MGPQRVFTAADQQAFADLSGDHNPLHLDALQARRLLFGGTVVHGVHQLLWALEATLPERSHIAALKAAFKKPALVDDQVALSAAVENTGMKIRQAVEGEDIAVFTATRAPLQSDVQVQHGNPARRVPNEAAQQWQAGASGSIPLMVDPVKLRTLFPRLPDLMSEHQIAFLLATTRLVGMECPGLRSIYSELDAKFTDVPASAPAALDWRVETYDARFSKVVIAGSSSVGTCKIAAFVRPEPAQQPSYDDAKQTCAADAFRGRRALVIGGSRGLGEITAKLLAAGGADVRLTYHRGQSDARAVVEQIRSGGGTAASYRLDVTAPDDDLATLMADGWAPTHLYYFATPPIFRGGFVHSEPLYERFKEVYVTAFERIVQAVRAQSPARLSVFYPSSTAIDERPRAMNEYIAAKLQGEELCRELSKHDRITVHVERLPRLKTDQTATVMPIVAADPLPVMARILAEC